mgnify:CR=1 FL=1
MKSPARAALLGAGNIASVHAEALNHIGAARIAAVIDSDTGRAEALARLYGVEAVFGDVDTALAAGGFNCVHVLTPPATHFGLAQSCLHAGYDVLLEKPMAETGSACQALLKLASEKDLCIGVNQNFRYHPAFARASWLARSGRIGTIDYVSCVYRMPLRQLASGQLGHWMFDSPRNLLLEQAVHPLSQLVELLGPIEEIALLPTEPARAAGDVPVQTDWLIDMRCKRASAQMAIALDASHPIWQLQIMGSDGATSVDMIHNRVVVDQPTQWPDFIDDWATARRQARQLRRQGRAVARDYVLSLLKMKQRSDAFFVSMRDSIAAFYASRQQAERLASAELAAHLVSVCEDIAGKLPEPDRSAASASAPKIATAANRALARHDVLVIGGTGLIGRETVRQLHEQGYSVLVLARSTRNLPSLFGQNGITVMTGDVTRPDQLEPAIRACRFVVNLAQGGGGETWDAVERAVVGSAEAVADLCQAAGTERLVYTSSIAALFLGDPYATVTDDAEPDRRGQQRALYARAKGVAEQRLLRCHRVDGLPVVIMRPGLVVGGGADPIHSGLGFANRPQHIIGWNRGTNPLPFVLVADVAAALIAALHSQRAVGKTYNLVGDVRPTARQYLSRFREDTGRAIAFQPQDTEWLGFSEWAKWLIKVGTGRRDALRTTLRDLRSRGLASNFDTTAAKNDLGWQPVADPEAFYGDAFGRGHG